jgi:hypothetical protein
MKQAIFAALMVFLGGIVPVAQATPSRIILIRHAEKPDDDSAKDLNAAGVARANALVDFFATNAVIAEKGEPQFIFAKYKKGSSAPTMRAVETVTPLARALGIAVDTDYGKKNMSDMTSSLLKDAAYDGKVVLICWDHDELPDLAQALGITAAPAKWKGGVYDRFWVADFDSEGSVTTFQDLPQHLMPGDSTQSVFIRIHF